MKIDYKKYPLPKRLRHHTKPNLYLKLSELKEEVDYYPPLIESIDWKDFFSNSKPADILDVGCGKAVFLLNMAKLFPDKNFLGIEVRKPIVEWINHYVSGEKTGNCKAIWYSVVNGLGFIENDSVEQVFYLFPDPWPKRKHLKRRAFNEEFIEEVARILKHGGKFYLATDIKEVDDYHRKLVEKTGLFNVDIVDSAEKWNLPVTNKEMFCIKENIAYYRLICSLMG